MLLLIVLAEFIFHINIVGIHFSNFIIFPNDEAIYFIINVFIFTLILGGNFIFCRPFKDVASRNASKHACQYDLEVAHYSSNYNFKENYRGPSLEFFKI